MAGRRTHALGAVVLGLGFVVAALVALSSGSAFVGSPVQLRARQGAVPLRAEGEKSVALVKVTEENAITTASLLGGTVGLLTGGVWIGAALFAVSSYLSRQEDSDVSKALKGVSSTALEALNFGAYLNDKYAVTSTVSDSFASALESNPETKKTIDDAWSGVKDAYTSVDQDVGIKDTLGTILASGSELASQAVDKAVELNNKYKFVDQIGEKISEVIDQVQSSKKA
mmetsp:Transcript_77336/g.216173  ORF Transcript_77336/g.216173 Transcript_77336/m.216173 type:complete len:227 (-) Transcript_77336:478-1158(-)